MCLEFKDYKEKQKYYARKAKESRLVWESSDGKKNGIIKGRTYVKPKGEKNGRSSN